MPIRFCRSTKDALKALKPLYDDIPYLGIDIETYNLQTGNALDPHTSTVRTFQFNYGSTIIPVFDLMYVDWSGLSILHERLRDRELMKLAHNAKFEYKHVKRSLRVIIRNLECTMLREKVIKNGRDTYGFGLNDIAFNELGIAIPKDVRSSDWSVPELSNAQIRYAARDVRHLYDIYKSQEERMSEAHQKVWRLEKDVLPILGDMELTGIKLNTKQVKKACKEYQVETNALLRKLQKEMPKVPLTASERNDKAKDPKCKNRVRDKLTGELIQYPEGFKPVQNLNDFKKALGIMGIELPKMYDRQQKKYRVALTKDTVHFIKHPVSPLLAEYNEHASMLSKYLTKMGEWTNAVTGRVHTDISQILVTGRIAMADPPLQQIPKASIYRSMFVAEPGKKILKIDYSQLELRILAEVTKDRGLIDEYSKGLEADLHSKTAKGIFGGDILKKDSHGKSARDKAKPINFGAGYGQGGRGFQQYLWKEKIYKSEEECQEWLNGWFDLYPGVKRYHNQTADWVKSHFALKRNGAGQYIVDQNGNPKLTVLTDADALTVHTLCGRPRDWEIEKMLALKTVGAKMGSYGRPYIYAICNDMINHPVQGTAGDGAKRAKVNVNKALAKAKLSRYAKFILQVHDEFVFEVDEEYIIEVAQLVTRVMESTMQAIIKSVPIYCEASYGDTWAAGSKIDIRR